MEYYSTSFNRAGQLYAECISDNRSGIRRILNHSVHRAEVIYPEPRRMSSASFVADSHNRLCSKTKSVSPTHSGENLGIFDIILSRDDREAEFESNQMSFFCGSPPVRASNPVIHDAEFEKETSLEASMENSLEGNLIFARVDKVARASSSPGSSHGMEQPSSRVDGPVRTHLGNFHGGKPLVVKMERASSPSCGSSVGGKPKVRIEGFASGNSESNCVVSALA